MKPSGFLSIHVDVPEQEQAPRAQVSGGGGYSVHFGWIHGELYLTDQGGAGRVLVNSIPVEPHRPVAIQVGDKITIGNAHLTWNPVAEAAGPRLEPEGAGDPKATLVLPPAPAKPPGQAAPGGTAEPTQPAVVKEPPSAREEGDEPAPAISPDATLFIPKGVAEQVRAAAQDPTLLVPKAPPTPGDHPRDRKHRPSPDQAPGPATPGGPDPTLVMPKTPATPGQAAPGPPAGRPAPDAPDDEAIYRTAWVDMAQIAEVDTDLEFESTTILRDTQTPHLIVHTPHRTWAQQFTTDAVTIGRGARNDIVLDDEAVSQYHALVERSGDGFVIRDTGSRNGVWLGGKRVEELGLRDGDVLSVGRVKLVFRGGFASDELTLIGPPSIEGKPERRPVVFVPGLMGSELWIGSERLWPDAKTIISNPEVYALPGDPRIEVRGILKDLIIVPHLIQSRQYSAMGDYLESGLGYTRGKDLLEFGYDWRHDVRLSAQRLAEAIEAWQVQGPVTIIAHSLGTLVTRYYVERLGGKGKVERLVLMGGPYHGTPKALAGVLLGPDLLPFGMAAERMRAVLSTFPSSFQILPTYPCVEDQNGNIIDILDDMSWLPEQHRPLLKSAQSHFREVGTVSSVPAVSVFGYGLKTKLRVNVDRGPDGEWRKVDFVEDTAGDQSVPSGSAVLKDSDIHPVFQEHGSLYVDDDVRMRLKVELTRSTRWQGRKK